MLAVVQVGMADLKAVKYPDKVMTAGLGSCVGVCLYDRGPRIAGLAHIMLPSSQQARNLKNPAKFADLAIEILLQEMEEMGARRRGIIAKIAGGAQMFNFSGENDIMKIGLRNSQAVKENLKRLNIRLVASDIGGNHGRTIIFDSASGELLVRTIGHGERIL